MAQPNEADRSSELEAPRAPRDDLPALLQRQGRFRLLRELGRGAMGRVWEVHDLERGGLSLALKELKHVTPGGILLFKQEFRALRDVRHPNLVALDELFESEGFWFFTMECIRGLAFGEHVADATGLGYCEERLREALRQLALGVHAVHRAGMVHRDLKPSNLMVSPEGRLVILDFGVAAQARRTATDARYIVGTAAYMAPEQAQGKAPTPAADWYAVGVILFEALTGSPPFTGVRELLEQKLAPEPPRPSHPNRALPQDLVCLAQALLHPDPRCRPTTAEILGALGADEGLDLDASPQREDDGALFVGRRRELHRLTEISRTLAPDELRTVVVQGQSGVGKSSLVSKYLRMLDGSSGAPVLVLQGRCHEREAVPYKAFDGVVDDLAHFLTGAGRSLLASTAGLADPRAFGSLIRLFPALGAVHLNATSMTGTDPTWETAASSRPDETTRHVASAPSATRHPVRAGDPDEHADDEPTHDASTVDALAPGEPAQDEQDARQRAFVLLAEVLRTIGSSCRLVVAVDDIQWADDDSLALLGALTEQRFPGMLLLTARDTAEARKALESVRGPVERIELTGLSARETRELAAALRSEDDAIDPAFVARVIEESGGHPMFVEELVRQRGEAHRSGTIAFDLDTALRRRIATFSEPAQRLLATIAVGGSPVPHGAVAAAARLEAQAYRQELDALSHARLVRAGGTRNSDTVECYHDRVREAVYDALEPEPCRRYHARLAVALERHGGVAPDVLAHHAERGGDLASAAAHSLVAARAAEDMFAFRRAAKHYDAALRLGEHGREQRARLLEAKGQALQYGGIARQAAGCYAEAASLRTGLAAIDLRRRSAEQLLMGGEVRKGKAEAEHVLAPFGKRLPRTEAGLLLSLGWGIVRVLGSRLRFAPRAEEQCPRDALVSIDMAWSVGAGLSMIDTVTGMQFSLDGFMTSLRVGEPFRIARSGCTSSVVFSALQWRNASRRSELICERATEMFGGERARAYLEIARMASTFLLEQRWSAAEEHARAAVKAWKQAGMGRGFEFDFATLFATWCRAMRGELRAERAEVDALLREAQKAGNRFLEVSLRVFHHLPALAEGRPDDVRADVADAVRTWQDQPNAFQLPHCWALLSRRAALLYDDRLDEDDLDRELWYRVRRSVLWMVGYVRDQARAMQARWELACAFDAERRGQTTRAWLHRVHASRLAARLCRDRKPVTHAWGRLVSAGVHASRHRFALARSDLERAIQLLDTSDSRLTLAAAQWRFARLVGGEAGDRARRAAQAYIDQERIAAPEAMFRAVAPWPGAG